MQTEMLTPVEVAAALGVSKARLYQMARTGGLPSCRIGRLLRFPRRALQTWMDARNEEAMAHMRDGEVLRETAAS